MVVRPVMARLPPLHSSRIDMTMYLALYPPGTVASTYIAAAGVTVSASGFAPSSRLAGNVRRMGDVTDGSEKDVLPNKLGFGIPVTGR